MAFFNPRRARRVFAALAVWLFAACVFIASGPHRHDADFVPFATTGAGSVAHQPADYHAATALSSATTCPLCDWLAAPSLPLVLCNTLCLPPTVSLQAPPTRRLRPLTIRSYFGRAASRAPPVV